MVEFEDAVSERMAQLEQEDLERYQRDLDLQRRIVRMRRPIQRFEMRVPDYYRRFCYWKEEMVSMGYPEDESSYIDDFIGNLQWHIQLRVSNRRSRLSRLVDAYSEAKFEETTILLERMVKDLKAANDIDEMANQTTIKIQRDDDICISVEKESIDNSQQAESDVEKLKATIAEPYAHQLFDDMPRSLSIELKEEDGDSDGAYTVVETQSNDCAIKSDEDGNDFTAKLLPENLSGKQVSLYSFPYFYESGSSVSGSCWISGLITDISKVSTPNLNYGDDVLGVSEHNSPSLPCLGFNPQVFDPGTLALFKLHCITSGIFLVYLHEYGEFSVYFHLVIGLWGYLFEWARSRDSQIDWVLSIWNRMEAFLWHCSVLLWNYNITRVYNSIHSNSTSTVTHVVWSNRPLANFHVGALAEICTAFDQSVPKITNGHYMGNGSSNVYVTFVGFLIQRLPFEFYGRPILDIVKHQLYTLPVNNFGYQNDGLQKVTHQNKLFWEILKPTQAWAKRNSNDELLVVGFNFNNLTLVDSGGDRKYALRYCYIGGVVPPLFGKAQRKGVKAITEVVLLLRHVHSKLLSNFLYCWSSFLEGLTNNLDLVTSFGSWIGLLSPMTAEFAWDPGICAIFIYILEDKDVLEWVGKDILLMDSISVILSNWCNDSDTHCLMNGLVNTLFSHLECFWCHSITFKVCWAKSAFIWLRPILQMVVVWCVLNNIIKISYIEVSLTQPAMLVVLFDLMYLMFKRVSIGTCGHVSLIYTSRLSTLPCCSFGHIDVYNASYTVSSIHNVYHIHASSRKYYSILRIPYYVLMYNLLFDHDDYIGLRGSVLFLVLHKNIEEFNDSIHVIFNTCPDTDQDGIHCITFLLSNGVIRARIAGSSKKAKGMQNNCNIIEWCVMASMHYLDRIKGIDGNVVAFTYHSFESYFTDVVKSMVFVNLKGFVWDPGRVLYGIRLRYKVESLVAIGKYFDTTSILMEVTTSTIFSFVTKVVGCADSSLELGGVLLIVLCEKQCRQWYDLFLAIFSSTRSQWLVISEDKTSGHVRNFMSQSGAYNITGASMSKFFVWDPGGYHFTTLRTRRFLRGRSCHDLRSMIRNNTEGASMTIKYQLLTVSCVIWCSYDVIALYMSDFIILSIPNVTGYII